MSAERSLIESSPLSLLLKARNYQRSAVRQTLNSEIDEIQKLDKFVEAKQKLWLILCLVGFALFFVTLLSGQSSFVVVAIAGAFAYCLFKWITWRGKNLANERYLLAAALLELFGRDMKDDSPISLRLGFENIVSKQNKLNITRSDRSRYMSSWLAIAGQLADGSKYSLRLAQLLDVKVRKGKQKPKGYVLTLSLAFSKKSYGILQIKNETLSKIVQVHRTAQLKSSKVKGNVVQLSAKMPDTTSSRPEDITNELCLAVKFLLLSSYEILNIAQKSKDSSAS